MDLVRELATNGAVVWRQLFAPELIDAAANEFNDRFGKTSEPEFAALAARQMANPVLRVGDKRYEVAVPMQGGFLQPQLFANPTLMPLLASGLGPRFVLNSFVVVVSHPGAGPQHTHRDHGTLFENHTLDATLPPHAINVAVPLRDLDPKLGLVGYWPGSHLWPAERQTEAQGMVAPLLKRGDAFIFDYRTIHVGLTNHGDERRSILYMVYARPWFFDEKNHKRRNPINVALEARQALPSEAQALLARAWAAHARQG